MNQPGAYRYSIRRTLFSILIFEILFWGALGGIYYYVQHFTEGFRFQTTNYLWLWLSIPIINYFHLSKKNWQNKALGNLAHEHLLPLLLPTVNNVKIIIRFLSFRIGIGLVILALANPQYGINQREVASKGIDIMIAVDISNSMKAEDLAAGYSRLKVAKLNIEKLIDKLHGDHLGIVLFAGDAYKHLPITPDYHMAKTFTQTISTRLMSAQGTDIGLAIEKCMDAFDFENGANKTIVVFSDGEDHEENGKVAAEESFSKGVVVHTIGMGTPIGVPIPIYQNGQKIGNKKDENDNTVLTKLNEENLINIASAGGGSYTLANGLSIGLEGLIDEISKIEKSVLATEMYAGYDDQFQIFLSIGLILLFVYLLLDESRSKSILQKLKFNFS